MRLTRPFLLDLGGGTYTICRERGDLLKAAEGLAALWCRPLAEIREALLGWHVCGEDEVDGRPAPLFAAAGSGVTLARWAGSWGMDLAGELAPEPSPAPIVVVHFAGAVEWMHAGRPLTLRAPAEDETADAACPRCRSFWRVVGGVRPRIWLEDCPNCSAELALEGVA